MGRVKEWKASYYCDVNKRWIYGRFILYTRFIRFVDDARDSNDVDFKLYFDDFLELRKESTGIFYAAITIRVKNVKYWFSSFHDRGYVFNTTEHFWKERLFSGGENEVPHSTEFISMLYDAQDTLASTGQTVLQQGHQIDTACKNMNKLHNDLDVGETIIHSLDSWLNQWNIETPCVQISVPDSRKMIQKKEYPVVFARSQNEKHLPGCLVISCQSLDVFSAQGNLDHSFAIKHVTEINVNTPWEFTISELAIGKAGHSVHLISARLVYILQTLENLLPAGIIIYEPPENTVHEEGDATERFLVQGDKVTAASNQMVVLNKTVEEGVSCTSASKAEVAEMSRVLQNMKCMALGIQEEQDRQLHQLENLSDSVDKANERLRKDTRNVNKLS